MLSLGVTSVWCSTADGWELHGDISAMRDTVMGTRGENKTCSKHVLLLVCIPSTIASHPQKLDNIFHIILNVYLMFSYYLFRDIVYDYLSQFEHHSVLTKFCTDDIMSHFALNFKSLIFNFNNLKH
jgi:hypothetical protein